MKFSIKNIKKDQVLIVLLVGILLIIIAIPTQKEELKLKTSGQTTSKTMSDTSSYEDEIEKKLENTLREVEGVGEVKVMVTLRTSSEKVIEKDTEQDSQTVDESAKGGEKTITKDGSTKETTVYDSTDGTTQTPYVSKEISPQIQGVLVIAKGGGNAVVIENITAAVQALFEVDTHKIKIMKMN